MLTPFPDSHVGLLNAITPPFSVNDHRESVRRFVVIYATSDIDCENSVSH